ncbi:MAG: hypothetical protein R6U50_18585 [Desulfobacterales bacterium]
MDQFDKTDLNRLISHPEGLCVSIYIPTIRKGHEVSQNQIRFKNALSQAEDIIQKTRGKDASRIGSVLDPAKKRLSDKRFWLKQEQGLAVFLSQHLFSFYRTPLNFEPLVIVNDRFHLKPLLPLFVTDAAFFLLAATQKSAKLFECTRHSISQVIVEDMPAGIADVLKYDLGNEYLTVHTGRPGRYGGDRGVIFHGQGPIELGNDQVLRYFQAIDKAIHHVLNKESRPLLFAGLDRFFPLYKQANSYPYLITDAVLAKNPATMTDDQLLTNAWEVLDPFFRQEVQTAIDKYHDYKGTGKTGADLRQIIYRAISGRVDYLIVGVGVHLWGKYNPATDEIAVHDQKEPSDEDLLDLAAFATIINGGRVYAVPPERVPDDVYAAAFYRF